MLNVIVMVLESDAITKILPIQHQFHEKLYPRESRAIKEYVKQMETPDITLFVIFSTWLLNFHHSLQTLLTAGSDYNAFCILDYLIGESCSQHVRLRILQKNRATHKKFNNYDSVKNKSKIITCGDFPILVLCII